MRLRLLSVVLLWTGAALLVAGGLLLFSAGARQSSEAALRSGLRRSRVQERLGVDLRDEAAVTRVVARHGRRGKLGRYPHLTLSGPAYARGFAYGRLLHDEVHGQGRAFFRRILSPTAMKAGRWYAHKLGFAFEGRVGWLLGKALDSPLVRERVLPDYLDEIYALLEPHIPDRYQEEMLGLADGAGVDPQMVRRFHAVSEIASAGCSNLAAWGRATRDGRYLQYRNLDWALDLRVQDYPLVLEHLPEGELRGHLSFGFAGFVGALQGLNDHGVTLGEVGAGSRAVSYDGQPLVFRMRRLLEEARDLSEVDRIMSEDNRTKGYNFVIGHIPARHARVYEMNRERVVSFEAGDPSEQVSPWARTFADTVLRGDFAVHPAIRARQYAAGGPGDPSQDYSYTHRYAGVADLAQAHLGAIDLAVLERMARQSGEKSQNLVSVLYTEEAVHFAYAEGMKRACSGEYLRLDYAGLESLAGLPSRITRR